MALTIMLAAVGLMQLAAFIDGMALYFHIGTILSIIIFVVVYGIPMLGAWQALILAAPGIVLSIVVYSIDGLMIAFQHRSA